MPGPEQGANGNKNWIIRIGQGAGPARFLLSRPVRARRCGHRPGTHPHKCYVFFNHRQAHYGLNPLIQLMLVQSLPFSALVQRVKAFVTEHAGDDEIALVFRCRHGKHRSVALADLFGFLFQSLGHEVTVTHQSYMDRVQPNSLPRVPTGGGGRRGHSAWLESGP